MPLTCKIGNIELKLSQDKKTYFKKVKNLVVKTYFDYLNDKNELLKLKASDIRGGIYYYGENILSEIIKTEIFLINNPAMLIPSNAENNLNNNKSEYIPLYENYYYEILANFTKDLRKKFKEKYKGNFKKLKELEIDNRWIISVKLPNPKIKDLKLNDSDNQHRLIYEVYIPSDKDKPKELIFLNCFRHHINKYKEELKNAGVNSKTGAFSKEILSNKEKSEWRRDENGDWYYYDVGPQITPEETEKFLSEIISEKDRLEIKRICEIDPDW